MKNDNLMSRPVALSAETGGRIIFQGKLNVHNADVASVKTEGIVDLRGEVNVTNDNSYRLIRNPEAIIKTWFPAFIILRRDVANPTLKSLLIVSEGCPRVCGDCNQALEEVKFVIDEFNKLGYLTYTTSEKVVYWGINFQDLSLDFNDSFDTMVENYFQRPAVYSPQTVMYNTTNINHSTVHDSNIVTGSKIHQPLPGSSRKEWYETAFGQIFIGLFVLMVGGFLLYRLGWTGSPKAVEGVTNAGIVQN